MVYKFEKYFFLSIFGLILNISIAIPFFLIAYKSSILTILFILFVLFLLYLTHYIYRYIINKNAYIKVNEKGIVAHLLFKKVQIKWEEIKQSEYVEEKRKWRTLKYAKFTTNARGVKKISLKPFRNPTIVYENITHFHEQINRPQFRQEFQKSRNKKGLAKFAYTSFLVIVFVLVIGTVLFRMFGVLPYSIYRMNQMDSFTMTYEGNILAVNGTNAELTINGITYRCTLSEDIDCTDLDSMPVTYTYTNTTYYNPNLDFNDALLLTDYHCSKSDDVYVCKSNITLLGHPDRITLKIEDYYITEISIHFLNDVETYTVYITKINETELEHQ